MKDVLAVVLAGGKGTRLEPLTRDRAKPAVPFGGAYRIIDFTLSNCLNSGIKRILMPTQYKAMSLDRHICNGWRKYFCRELGEFIDLVPPQQRVDENWYQGTADAVYQNIYSLERENPELVLILAGDHIYKMDYSEMVRFHGDQAADLTIAALEVDQESARQFGVMEIDSTGRIIGFEEKPAHPKSIPGKPGRCLASMGIYIFGATFLYDQLLADANCESSQHDFGKNIIPSIIESHRVYAYPFADRNGKSSPYWRDVGTLDAYYRANMDLIEVAPELNVYDSDWPIRSQLFDYPPPKFVFGSDNEEVRGERVGMAVDSIVCSGSIISGGRVDRSILGSNVRINSYSKVTDSILFDAVEVGRNARIQRSIVDKERQDPARRNDWFRPRSGSCSRVSCDRARYHRHPEVPSNRGHVGTTDLDAAAGSTHRNLSDFNNQFAHVIRTAIRKYLQNFPGERARTSKHRIIQQIGRDVGVLLHWDRDFNRYFGRFLGKYGRGDGDLIICGPAGLHHKIDGGLNLCLVGSRQNTNASSFIRCALHSMREEVASGQFVRTEQEQEQDGKADRNFNGRRANSRLFSIGVHGIVTVLIKTGRTELGPVTR